MLGKLQIFVTHLSKKLQPGGFTSRLLRSLPKTSLLLMKNVRQPLAKNVLMPLGQHLQH